MLSQPILLAVVFTYILGLVIIALWAERHKTLHHRLHPYIYSLSLAVYCSSWTYFGAVGTAVNSTWHYISIYAAPLCLFLLGRPLIRKLAQVGTFHKTTSVADFIGTRYGKRKLLAGLVSLVAVVGSMPYIALQLKAVSTAWQVVGANTGNQFETAANLDTALITALFLAVFAVLFGTRHIESRERNHGMMAALAVESLVKLVALLLIAGLAIGLLVGDFQQNSNAIREVIKPWQTNPFSEYLFTTFLLSLLAIICLPRQFHVTVVEYLDEKDIKTAGWLFPLYLLVIILLVIPIAIAGQYLYLGTSIEPDSYVLQLPMDGGHALLTVLGFIGGFSAATGMAIVATVTLSIMVSNEIILPLLFRFGSGRFGQAVFLGRHIRWMRRLCIFGLLLTSWLIYRLMVEFQGLASIGLISFACFAQLAPALLGAIYWQKGHARGVYAGLAVGFIGWFYCLLLPTFFAADSAFMTNGPWGISWLHPYQLFGITGLEPLTHGVLWSLLPNIVCFIVVSLLSKPSSQDALQAEAFVVGFSSAQDNQDFQVSALQVKPLRVLLDSFVDLEQQKMLWRKAEASYQQRLLDDDYAPMFVVNMIEETLSGVIGAASAQQAIELLGRSGPLEFKDIAAIVGDTSKQLKFNEDLLQVTIETVSQGISVVDSELRLVAWNRRYEQLFDYPPRLLYVGCPIEAIYRYNAEQGIYEDGTCIEEQVARRIELLKTGGPHQFERTLPNGITVQVIGNPMSSGGFVTSYIDVSEYRLLVQALEDAKTTLEDRVRQRTEDLSLLNAQLANENTLRAEAEQEVREMHRSKNKFMQATSHDLLQPISAAKLFCAALQQQTSNTLEVKQQVDYIAQSLATAEGLIDSLRELVRLESGSIVPAIESFNIAAIMKPLTAEFDVLAQEKGLALKSVICNAWVASDPKLLRRILQNFLSNAIHYTKRGKVVLGCRRKGDKIVLQVWDTGPGISDQAMQLIFNEFERLSPGVTSADKGLGLGLSIAKGMAQLLGHEIKVATALGKGSVFSLEIPLSKANNPVVENQQSQAYTEQLAGKKIVYIDNEEQILRGIDNLLSQWGCEISTAQNAEQAQKLFDTLTPDIILLDFHLEESLTGLDLMQSFPKEWQNKPIMIISADTSDATKQQVIEAGCSYMAKPIEPNQLAEGMVLLLGECNA